MTKLIVGFRNFAKALKFRCAGVLLKFYMHKSTKCPTLRGFHYRVDKTLLLVSYPERQNSVHITFLNFNFNIISSFIIGFPDYFFLSEFPIKLVCAFLIRPKHAAASPVLCTFID
jgi:hypothetical protein